MPFHKAKTFEVVPFHKAKTFEVVPFHKTYKTVLAADTTRF